MKFVCTLGLALCLAGIAPRSAASAEIFSARLVPRAGTGATGSGTATLTLDNEGVNLSFVITVSGLSGPEIASHIHEPDGSIAFALPPGETKVGVWQNVGLIDLFLLRSDQLYILVHTDQNPSGELRGDIHTGPLAARAASWGAVKALYESPSR